MLHSTVADDLHAFVATPIDQSLRHVPRLTALGEYAVALLDDHTDTDTLEEANRRLIVKLGKGHIEGV